MPSPGPRHPGEGNSSSAPGSRIQNAQPRSACERTWALPWLPAPDSDVDAMTEVAAEKQLPGRSVAGLKELFDVT
jgi:hypothetical protein